MSSSKQEETKLEAKELPKYKKCLTVDTMNEGVVTAQYAVRGPLVILADKYRTELAEGKKMPFNEVVSCNIGNPMELGQQPLTFIRQVLCLLQYPELMTSGASLFPKDIIARAQKYLKVMKGGLGAYSNSQGTKIVRDEVADFITARDGVKADPQDIYLTDGASNAVKFALQCIIRDKKDAVMIPIPQYPLYSGALVLLGGTQVGYYLDEEKQWGLNPKELETRLAEAKKSGLNVRALVVINPGNPTGQCLPEKQMQQIVEFCHRNSLIILADEVYQTNIYGSTPFTSFRKVVKTMKSDVELMSFHSVSKGFIGECGQRGGYLELTNIDTEVRAQIYKLFCLNVCSNLSGQIVMGLVSNPPKKGDESYELYMKEREAVLASYKRRATKVAEAMNKSKNITCNSVEGAMYAFPNVRLPQKYVDEAKTKKLVPDAYYCQQLLESTGIVVVPGSGFGQKDNSFHFRTTILPGENVMDSMLKKFQDFNNSIMTKYSA
eukprot:TRINITY_DN194_c1_g2_i1.p1 TRINITY_DN194_c1_g2~~TRINITY_DN194_c1_g2_i1.p1  ORF type:complete len:503 (-),score=123.07 TRINITY_DN194_c1_g2_i1:410-1888(-)